jgi:hypothetical protein
VGKYSKFKDSMTSFTIEPEYQDRVNNEKDRVKRMLLEEGKKGSISEFAEVLLKARLEKARLEKLEKAENLTIEAMTQILVELMEDEALTNVKMDNGVSMSIKDDVYCNVENKQLFNQWIKETGQEDLLTVNYQTMASIVKKRLSGELTIGEGEETIPPGINTYFKQGIMVRGAKNLGIED